MFSPLLTDLALDVPVMGDEDGGIRADGVKVSPCRSDQETPFKRVRRVELAVESLLGCISQSKRRNV